MLTRWAFRSICTLLTVVKDVMVPKKPKAAFACPLHLKLGVENNLATENHSRLRLTVNIARGEKPFRFYLAQYGLLCC